jgi:amino acid transporter
VSISNYESRVRPHRNQPTPQVAMLLFVVFIALFVLFHVVPVFDFTTTIDARDSFKTTNNNNNNNKTQ